MNQKHRVRLAELLRKRAVRRGEFTLSSGAKSDFYLDGKMVQLFPEGAHLLGECLFELLEDESFDAIGGKAVGAVPLVTAFVVSCHHRRRPMEGFFVRDNKKEYGAGNKVEGVLKAGDRVVIIDDVCTKGGSTLSAIEGAEEAGAKVVLAAAVVDREEGGSEMLRNKGYEFRSLFTKEELLQL